ncbi:MAG TPA: hypothetical protein DEG70_03145 [Chloroflexi bacterium]|nr:hypothetical protein [Chloroflexota bacterium]
MRPRARKDASNVGRLDADRIKLQVTYPLVYQQCPKRFAAIRRATTAQDLDPVVAGRSIAR